MHTVEAEEAFDQATAAARAEYAAAIGDAYRQFEAARTAATTRLRNNTREAASAFNSA